jgi:hypothetical protein
MGITGVARPLKGTAILHILASATGRRRALASFDSWCVQVCSTAFAFACVFITIPPQSVAVLALPCKCLLARPLGYAALRRNDYPSTTYGHSLAFFACSNSSVFYFGTSPCREGAFLRGLPIGDAAMRSHGYYQITETTHVSWHKQPCTSIRGLTFRDLTTYLDGRDYLGFRNLKLNMKH